MAMSFARILLIAASSALTAQPAPTPDPLRDISRIEALVFSTGISDFVRSTQHHSYEDSRFDWSTDGCSAPFIGNTGASFDFSRPCLRHDFAYRNYKLLDSRYSCSTRSSNTYCAAADVQPGRYWNRDVRRRIDDKFKQDMLFECANRRGFDKARCRAWAETFYRAVRIAGGP